MGIRDLWSVLEPYHDRKPLFELSGRVVAIDLGGWVCENQNVVEYPIQPRLYLRNLFHRTCYLLLANVTPVFVLEGEAPSVKYDEIARRNDLQFRGGAPKKTTAKGAKSESRKGRTRFNGVLKLCEHLLDAMGVECVQGPGEAEAFCAHLNRDGLVDGVVSQDSDCFAYGARKVYRNFSVAKQGSVAASGGAVDVYDMEKIGPILDLGQNKIILMALLAGCDYCPEGVAGVGKDSVIKLISQYSDAEILQHVQNWRRQEQKFRDLEDRVEDKSVCVNCGHSGRLQSHSKKGCALCGMSSGCDSSLWRDKRLLIRAEVQIRRKALLSDDFPQQDVIDEFLQASVTPRQLNLTWKRPKVLKFVGMMVKNLQWEEIYAFQKILPLLTRWQLSHPKQEALVTPREVKKKRTLKGVSSFEVIWRECNPFFHGLIPDEQITAFLQDNPAGIDSLWTTIEPAVLLEAAHPREVQEFLDRRPQKRKKKRKPEDSLSTFDEMKDELRKIEKKAPRRKGVVPKGVQRIDKYFQQLEKEDSILKAVENLPESTEDVENLSDIIAGIVSQTPKVTNLNGRELFYDVARQRPVKERQEEDIDELDLLVAAGAANFMNFSTPKAAKSLPIAESDVAYLLENLNTTVDLFESTLELSRKVFDEAEDSSDDS
ncbi:flap endonuclease GEN [Phlebotomus argentipes]|uniref:flap endonuclease GEN n=1 Tax=Phlebotomus argentipes TaxID=94469 RepID=UPI00289304B4|nr:flap endonuclease GEN [Phlebotomus argentipes]